MPQQLSSATRVARKSHRCSMCSGSIASGESYHVSSNIYDERIYDWKTCAACRRDGITAYVYDWASWPDEGVGYDNGLEWAEEAERYARSDAEKAAARAFRERAGVIHETDPTSEGGAL